MSIGVLPSPCPEADCAPRSASHGPSPPRSCNSMSNPVDVAELDDRRRREDEDHPVASRDFRQVAIIALCGPLPQRLQIRTACARPQSRSFDERPCRRSVRVRRRLKPATVEDFDCDGLLLVDEEVVLESPRSPWQRPFLRRAGRAGWTWVSRMPWSSSGRYEPSAVRWTM